MTKEEIKKQVNEVIKQMPQNERVEFLNNLRMEHQYLGGTPEEREESNKKIADRITSL